MRIKINKRQLIHKTHHVEKIAEIGILTFKAHELTLGEGVLIVALVMCVFGVGRYLLSIAE